jgi:hypothetical protein
MVSRRHINDDTTAVDWTETISVDLSSRVSVTLSLGPAGITGVWRPFPPSLNREEWEAYKRARADLIYQVEARRGIKIEIVDLPRSVAQDLIGMTANKTH